MGVPITSLPNSSTTYTGLELVPLVQNAVTRKATLSSLVGYTNKTLNSLSGVWQSSYTTLSSLSSNWNSAYNELS